MKIKRYCYNRRSVSVLVTTTVFLCFFYTLKQASIDNKEFLESNYIVYSTGGDYRRRLREIQSAKDLNVYSNDAKWLSSNTKSMTPLIDVHRLFTRHKQVQYKEIKHLCNNEHATRKNDSLHDGEHSQHVRTNINIINNSLKKNNNSFKKPILPAHGAGPVLLQINEDSHSIEGNETLIALERAKRRLPQAIIIGVKKCGTRALLEYLRIHPNVKATGPEPHFFDRYYHLGLDWYRMRMPPSYEGQITIEKTPRYFVTKDAPERLYNMSRNIKLIIIVRNPVTRAISDFTQAASKGQETLTTTFRSKAFRRNGSEVNIHWSPITTGMYSNHLRKWLKYFPLQNMQFVSGEQLISNPASEMGKVQDFLEIQRIVTEEHFYFNKTKGFPCLKKHLNSLEAKCFNRAKGRHHSYVDEVTIGRLTEFYRPYNKDFYELTGRDFDWD